MTADLIGALAVAAVTLIGSLTGASIVTKRTISAELRNVQHDNALLYLWNRALVDAIYRGTPPPPPEPPVGLFGSTSK